MMNSRFLPLRQWRRWLVMLAFGLMSMSVVGPAMGQTTADRQASLDRVRQANEHYDAGEFRDALRLYKQAHRELGDDRLLYRIGLTYEYLNNVVRAREYLEAYLKADPQTPYAGRIGAKIESLGTLEQSVQAYLVISSEPAGATVFLNGDMGSVEGKTPVTVPVGPGEHVIALIFEDRRRLEDVVQVVPGQSLEHHVQVRAGTAPAEEGDGEAEAVAVKPEPAVTSGLRPVARHPDMLTEVRIGPPTWLIGLSWTGVLLGDGMIVGGLIARSTGNRQLGNNMLIGGAVLAGTGLYFLIFRNYAKGLEKVGVSGGIGASPDGTGVGFGFGLRY